MQSLLSLLLRLQIYHCVTLSSAWRCGFLSYTPSLFPANNKLGYLRATSVINSPWSVAAKCIAPAAGTVHSTQWSQTLAQNRDFCLPHRHSTPPLGEFPSEYCHAVPCGKTKIVWLPDNEKKLKIYLLVLTESTNVTDGQTDRRTHRQTPHDG